MKSKVRMETIIDKGNKINIGTRLVFGGILMHRYNSEPPKYILRKFLINV
jgi:hypothetical protein